jgi:hypothetical protein
MEKKPECTDICPECGLKLVFEKGICFCPGEYCGFKCSACSQGETFVLKDKGVK